MLLIFRTIQFVGISAFHTRISDPLIGGTYMTVRYPSFVMRIEAKSLCSFLTHLQTLAAHGRGILSLRALICSVSRHVK